MQLVRGLKVAAVSAAVLFAGVAGAADANVTAAIGQADTLLADVATKVGAVGGVIIGLAVIGAGIKWVKGTIFG